MIVVVGGQSRNIGKTTVVCDIIRATVDQQWIAIKISRHTHGADISRPVILEETSPVPHDSGRYLVAGAARAFWIRALHEHTREALNHVPEGNWIIESNSVCDALQPDLIVFVENPSVEDWKESARELACRADVTVRSDSTEAVRLVRSLIDR